MTRRTMGSVTAGVPRRTGGPEDRSIHGDGGVTEHRPGRVVATDVAMEPR
ncbi:MAG: hypothetical protein R2710_16085 [Acidimicrobiales bacterium]